MKKRETKLRRWRESSGMSQPVLAARLCLTKSAVSHAERTGIKTLRLAKRYALIFNCDPLELLG